MRLMKNVNLNLQAPEVIWKSLCGSIDLKISPSRVRRIYCESSATSPAFEKQMFKFQKRFPANSHFLTGLLSTGCSRKPYSWLADHLLPVKLIRVLSGVARSSGNP